jgi:hemolysin III
LFNSGIEIQTAINISYASMAVVVLFPVIWYLAGTAFRHGYLVLFAILSFSSALFFRWSDKFEWIEKGTHFLWHLFGVIAVHLMMKFLYLAEITERK